MMAPRGVLSIIGSILPKNFNGSENNNIVENTKLCVDFDESNEINYQDKIVLTNWLTKMVMKSTLHPFLECRVFYCYTPTAVTV